MQSPGRHGLSRALKIGIVLLVCMTACLLFVRWVNIPVRQAVFEKTHRQSQRPSRDMGLVAMADDAYTSAAYESLAKDLAHPGDRSRDRLVDYAWLYRDLRLAMLPTDGARGFGPEDDDDFKSLSPVELKESPSERDIEELAHKISEAAPSWIDKGSDVYHEVVTLLRSANLPGTQTPSANVDAPKSPAPLCAGPSTRYVDVFHELPGQWEAAESLKLDPVRCEKLCEVREKCAGYRYEQPARLCHLVGDGAQKISSDGRTFMRGSVTDWVPCS